MSPLQYSSCHTFSSRFLPTSCYGGLNLTSGVGILLLTEALCMVADDRLLVSGCILAFGVVMLAQGFGTYVPVDCRSPGLTGNSQEL